jgi:hypothetical protein
MDLDNYKDVENTREYLLEDHLGISAMKDVIWHSPRRDSQDVGY